MSAALIVETATGVFLSIAKEVAVTIISSKTESSSNWIDPKLAFEEENATSLDLKPIKDTTTVPELDLACKESLETAKLLEIK